MKLKGRRYRIEGIELPDQVEFDAEIPDDESVVQITVQSRGMPGYGFTVTVWTTKDSS